MKNSFVIITGLSGSGKSAAVRVFEDRGYYCVDNLPVAMIPVFADLHARMGDEMQRVALVVDIREGRFLDDFPQVLARIRQSHGVKVLFFEASNTVLARRFGETRRPHPMAGTSAEGLMESLAAERQTLDKIRAVADVLIDTSSFTVHDLKSYLIESFLDAAGQGALQVLVLSFGYKYGVPENMDLLFDVRFMANPFFVPGLRDMTGKDKDVVRFLQGKTEFRTFVDKTGDLLRFLLPLYVREGKAYLRIGVGCTGGKHRSVAVSEFLAKHLTEANLHPRIQHRDLDRE
ncbi:MAG: RNase adapter RapZ [Acidobacteriota bacterium]